MKALTPKEKEQAIKDLEMYLGTPPYDVDEVRHYITSGLFEQQALMKYGRTPVELIREVSRISLTEKQKKEAIRDLTMYFGSSLPSDQEIEQRLSSGLLDVQILNKYCLTVRELIDEVGFSASKWDKIFGTYQEPAVP